MKYSEAKKLYRYFLKSPLYVLIAGGVATLFNTIVTAIQITFIYALINIFLRQAFTAICAYGLWKLIVAVVYMFMCNVEAIRNGNSEVKRKSASINQFNKSSKSTARKGQNKPDLWSTSEYNFERKLREQQKVHSEEAEIQSTDREDMSNNV